MAWIKIEGQKFPIQDLNSFSPSTSNSSNIVDFIKSWQSGQQSFEFKTSGSTGKPKKIKVSRSQMEHSAKGTIEALKLMPGTTALLCMNPAFIGGKMMIVRSLINKMNLVVEEPSSSPLGNITDQIDFAALVPLQLANSINSKEASIKLTSISNVIVGGGEVSPSLKMKLKSLNNNIFSTYGMTETVSHIALQRLSKNSSDNHYTTIPGVEIGLDDRSCLTIKGTVTNNETIITNDKVELLSHDKFRWLGRIDNVINSGGIKIQIEEVENTIALTFNTLQLQNRFILKGISDSLLGERVVLVIEGNLDSVKTSSLQEELIKSLSKYEKPKELHFISHFEETPTNKIIRNKDYIPISIITI